MTNPTYSILFVDDDQFLVDMYSLKFSQAGHAIQAVRSVKDALERLRDTSYTPDAIVFDLVMPELDGFDLLKTIRDEKLAPQAVLVVLSNQGEKEDFEKAQSLGATGHIIKANAIPSEVLSMVEQYVQSRRA